MQFEAGVIKNKYTRYGNLMEPVAKSNYYESQHNVHEHFKVDETGFLISKGFPFLYYFFSLYFATEFTVRSNG